MKRKKVKELLANPVSATILTNSHMFPPDEFVSRLRERGQVFFVPRLSPC